MRVIYLLLIAGVIGACSSSRYIYEGTNHKEELLFLDKDSFLFRSLSKENEFITKGKYRIKDSNQLQLIFEPIKDNNLKYLPINESEVTIDHSTLLSDSLVINLKVADEYFSESLWGITAIGFLGDEEFVLGETDRYGVLKYSSLDSFDMLHIGMKGLVPLKLKLKDRGKYDIDVKFKSIRGRQGQGYALPDTGPLKTMTLLYEGNKIETIYQDDLDKKFFIHKGKTSVLNYSD